MLVLSFLQVKSQGIEFSHDNFKEALEKARKENKPIFIDFMTSWCGPCKVLSEKVFTQESVGAYFNEKFINCKIDGDANKALLEKYKINAYPTMLWLSPKGKEIKRVRGMVYPDLLVKMGKEVCGDRKPLKEIYSDFKKGKLSVKEQEVMLLDVAYFLGNIPQEQKMMWNTRFQKAYKSYVKNNGKEVLISDAGFNLIAIYEKFNTDESDMIKLLLKNYNSFKKVMKIPQNIDMYLVSWHTSYMTDLAKKGKLEYKKELERIKGDLAEVYKFIKRKGMDTYSLMKNNIEALYLLFSKKDEEKYISMKKEYLKLLGDDVQVNDYKSIIDNLFAFKKGEMSDVSYKTCIGWLKQAVGSKTINPSLKLRYLISIGQIYEGLKEKKEAISFYQKASAMAVQLGDKRMQQITYRLMEALKE